jgi:PAS domain S-box-containing protein
MSRKFSLTKYLGIWYVLLFVLMAFLLVMLVAWQMKKQALHNAESQAQMILDRNLATHQYFTQQLKPNIFKWTEPFRDKDYFDPSWMSSTYAVREIDKIFHQFNKEPYYYKESAINARSTETEADPREKEFLTKLQKDPHLNTKSEVRYFDGHPYLTVLKRGETMEASCLRCHSNPEAAPKDLVSIYGPEKSFGRSLDEVVQAISMRIPLEAAYAKGKQATLELSALMLSFLLAGFAFLFFFTRKQIVNPVDKLTEMASLISQKEKHLGMTIPEPERPELRELARAINLLSTNLKKSRDELETRVADRTAELSIANERLEEEIAIRRETETALAKSMEKFRQVFEQVPVGLNILELDETIAETNSQLCQLLGMEQSDIIGRKFSDVIDWADKLSNRLPFDEILDRKIAIHEKIIPIVCAEGKPKWIHLTLAPLVGDGGFPIYLIAMLKDIDEKILQEQALKESETRNRLLIEHSPVGISILHEGMVHYANPLILEIFGYDDVHEILGRPAEDFFAPENRELVTKWRQNLLSGEPSHKNHDLKGLKKNGELVDLSVWPTIISFGGKPSILTFIADRTEASALKAQLFQAQKMEAVGTLAGGVAHDFNNILQVITGYCELIMLNTPEGTKKRSDLEIIYQSAKKGADLVRRLLMFSRKTEVKLKPCNLNNIVLDTQKLISRIIPKMINIELRLADPIKNINADAGQIEQVLLNLAINAKDAMPKGGGLIIQTRDVTVDERFSLTHPQINPGDYVLLSVTDSGKGMEKMVLERIFEPFFTTKKIGEGTGLGLAMVFGIVNAHNGRIFCNSQLGKGTTFEIYLPVITVPGISELNHDVKILRSGNGTILVVDDEPSIIDFERRILTESGYKVVIATSAAEALRLYSKERDSIDVVILDYVMPETSGIECLERLKEINPDIRAVFASGYSFDTLKKEMDRLGVCGFIPKPFDARTFLLVVSEALEKNRLENNGGG